MLSAQRASSSASAQRRPSHKHTVPVVCGVQALAASQRARRAVAGCKTSFVGHRVIGGTDNGSLRWRSMSTWLENKASVDVPLPLEACWVLWDDREKIPKWMPWIKSVKIQESDPRLSRWTLSTEQFGRTWEFSWLARNLAPIKNQRISWISEPGSTSMPGLEVANRGQIRFARRGPSACNVSLTISYEVPDVLAPFANALTPVVEDVISKDMEKFRQYALDHTPASASN